MKNKNLKEFINGKGFYIILSVCFMVILISAVVVTVRNSNEMTSQNKNVVENNDYSDNIKEQQTKSVSLTEPETTNLNIFDDEDLENIGIGISENNELNNIETNELQQEIINNIEESSESTEPNSEAILSEEASSSETETETQNISEAEANEETVEDTEPKETEPVVEQIFLSYDENTKMIWPAQGEILMDFSKDHTIYDKTLEQYRINDCLSIKADVGTPVKAAATGTVTSIVNDSKGGYTVTLDHGNGWQTTYSQLQENLAVTENQVVQAGDIIGGVSDPTIYSVALGSHLDFKVMKNGESLNPKSFLDD